MANLQHILSAKDLTKEQIEEILEKSDGFLKYAKKEETSKELEGKILATLFYEPSTRTRLSFETAMLRLGGSVISVADKSTSSLMKGESLSDTAKVISQFADIVAIRHGKEGSAKMFAESSSVPVINAGDGTNQHPTQALLDLYTIKKELGTLDGLTVAFSGDLTYGRTASSLSYLLSNYDVKIRYISPSALKMKDSVKEDLKEKEIEFEETEDFEKGIEGCDVLYVSRIQEERFADPKECEKCKGIYVLDRAMVEKLMPKALIMHALPRVDEIATDVDDLPGAVYFKQVSNGLAVRMALLSILLT